MIEKDGLGLFKQSTTLAKCSNRHEWTVSGKGYEGGQFVPDDPKDLICPECGKRGSINPDNPTEEEGANS